MTLRIQSTRKGFATGDRVKERDSGRMGTVDTNYGNRGSLLVRWDGDSEQYHVYKKDVERVS